MLETAKQALVVKDLHKNFGRIEVLKGISLTALEGDVISLIGSSGSGKTTLLRCINLLDIPDAGEVYLSGQLIKMKTGRRGKRVPQSQHQIDLIRTRIGMVFQHFNLWSHMTILENVMEAPVYVLKQPKKLATTAAMEMLDKVGIADKAKYYPANLSGGQQQRAAIARVLVMNPELILFDEPTSALDPELVGEVLQVIEQLAKEGRTMIIATHEMEFARDVSSMVMFLDQGRIAEQGGPKKIFSDPDSARCRQFLARFF